MQRRDFLKWMGAGAGALGAAAVAGTNISIAQDHTMPMPANPTQQTGGYAEMDAHHAEGVNTFVANIGQDTTFWRTPMEPVMDGDVKVFDLVCEEIQWETMLGTALPAMAYNGMVPGPEIRVTEGDQVRFNLTNNMTQSTAIHFHGLRVPNSVDGVPFVTQPVIIPGETQSFEFTVRNAGTHMYHSHHNSAEQVTKGLLGALIVEPADKSREPEVSADYTLIMNDSGLGFTLNGKGFPYTQPIVATLGDKIRIRYMNEGLMIHPMHLHGIPQLVFAKDGFYLPSPYMCDTLNIAPGERYDVLVDCDEVGLWAFHCHILTHAESSMGMFGMVTVLIINEA
ncbi:MAG: multicopper oxidase domain-containing protein [Chitinophagaceae bacterium]|nr:multicopper oxidase domain-containing protein [Anaerolineae bacterium]